MAHSTTSSHAVQQAILQAIYAVFLGGVMTAVVAVGLFTFYPQPNTYQTQIEQLDQREQAIYSECKTEACTTTPAQQNEIRAIELEREEVWKAQEVEQKEWNRTAGILMIGIATVLLAVSLVRWDRAIVISNGLLLGGLFTMVFGIGLTLAGGDDVVRFIVLAVALAITVVLGYLRFARAPKAAAAAEGGMGPDATAPGPADAALTARVDSLEATMDGIKRAFGD
ncbi:MAG: hypothetical protein QG597_1085 [Actinomycetota bacterium]|nr:hypothetical protein [Actinomycetota bacterium]